MFWRKKKEKRADSKTYSLGDPALTELFGGRPAKSGISVTPENSLQSTAVFGAVRIISETIGSLSLFLYRRVGDRGKERAVDHPLYPILHDLPNPELTRMELLETLTSHVLLWGNAYAEIVRGGQGEVKEIWPLSPNRVRVFRKKELGNDLFYEVSLPEGGTRTFRPSKNQDILHIRGLGSDGIMGYSPIRMAREAIGLGLAAEEFGSKFFANDATPGIILEYPGKLSEKAFKNFKESWEEKHKGSGNAFRVAFLEEGLKVAQRGMIPPEDAQFLQTRKFQIAEIARIFRVPLHMLSELDKATFSNIEQQSLEVVRDPIRPWLVRWELAMKRDQLVGDEKKKFFAEFLVDSLLRGDTLSRWQAYNYGRNTGVWSADDIREMENQNPISGGRGDTYLVPLNMVPVGSNQQNGSKAGSAEKRTLTAWQLKLSNAYRRLFEDKAREIIKRERADILRQAKKQKDSQELLQWLDSFYKDHAQFVEDKYKPVIFSYGEALIENLNETYGLDLKFADLENFLAGYTASLASGHVWDSKEQLHFLIVKSQKEEGDVVAALTVRFDEWEAKRVVKIAEAEAQGAGEAIVKAGLALAGIQPVS